GAIFRSCHARWCVVHPLGVSRSLTQPLAHPDSRTEPRLLPLFDPRRLRTAPKAEGRPLVRAGLRVSAGSGQKDRPADHLSFSSSFFSSCFTGELLSPQPTTAAIEANRNAPISSVTRNFFTVGQSFLGKGPVTRGVSGSPGGSGLNRPRGYHGRGEPA